MEENELTRLARLKDRKVKVDSWWVEDPLEFSTSTRRSAVDQTGGQLTSMALVVSIEARRNA